MEHSTLAWSDFQAKRAELLAPVDRYGRGAEKLAEDVVRAFLTLVVGWSDAEINPQVERADLVVTQLGVKRLVIETKHPGSLAFSENAARAARLQGQRYAEQQRVPCVVVSDGYVLHAVDCVNGTIADRLFCDLTQPDAPDDAWWIGPDGITETRPMEQCCRFRTLAPLGSPADVDLQPCADEDALLHPHYQLPAVCFAYVGSVADPATWHLPYLLRDGSIDRSRLPKAIGAIVKNYRGAHLKTVPESAIPNVLVTLGRAAAKTGKISRHTPPASATYAELVAALEQFGRLDEVLPK